MGLSPTKDGLSSLASPQPDGSIVSGEERAKRDIAKSLKAKGWSDDFIQKHFLDMYESAPDGIAIPIPGTGISFIRHKNVPTTINFKDLNAPFRYSLIAKIAIELYYTSGLAWDFPVQLGHTISAMMNNRPGDLAVARTEYSEQRSPDDMEYSAFHFASFGELNGHLVGVVGFFGRFTFAICLGGIERDDRGNWMTENWAFPIGGERRIQALVPPSDTRRLQYSLMVQALGSWSTQHH